MLTMYLRKESVVSTVYGEPRMLPCVSYYRDANAQQMICRNINQSRPTRRNKYVMYNCAKYKAIWLEDKV